MAEELLKGSLADTEVVEIRVKEDKPYIKPVKKKEKLEAIFILYFITITKGLTLAQLLIDPSIQSWHIF